MLFASNRLNDFFIKELNIPEELIDLLREQYIEAYLTYLETEINLFIEEKNMLDEINRLNEISKNDPSGANLIEEFIQYYLDYPEIKNKVDQHIKGFNDMFTAHVHQLLDEDKLQKMTKIINEDIQANANFRKKLSQEI